MEWTVGKSSLGQIDPNEGDASLCSYGRFYAYVERHHFGKHGGESYFYFAAEIPEKMGSGFMLEDDPLSRLEKADRDAMIPHTVAIFNSYAWSGDRGESEEEEIHEWMNLMVVLPPRLFEEENL